MANGNESTRNLAAESDPQPAMLTAEETVREIRALRARIPMPPPTVAPRRRTGHVNADFVTATVNAVGVSEAVRTGLGRSDEELRQEIDAVGRWAAAIDEMRALLKSMTAANTVRRQRIGLAALQTYKICQQLARDEGQQTRLAAHISEMKRLNKFGRSRRKPATEPEPVVATKTQ